MHNKLLPSRNCHYMSQIPPNIITQWVNAFNPNEIQNSGKQQNETAQALLCPNKFDTHKE